MISDDLALALDPARVLSLLPGIETGDPWQQEFLRSEAKRHLLLCTRQAGKSTTTAARAAWEAVYHPGSLILLISPSLRQSAELFKKVGQFYRHWPYEVPIKEESASRLELQNESRIIALPGKEETIRGYSGVSLILIDEASRVSEALYHSVTPMLAVSNGRLIALTTAFGRQGFFFDEWDGPHHWDRTKVTALECPRISPEFLAEERVKSEWWFNQEYMCEFSDAIDAVFTQADIEAAMDHDIEPLNLKPIFG